MQPVRHPMGEAHAEGGPAGHRRERRAERHVSVALQWRIRVPAGGGLAAARPGLALDGVLCACERRS